jgi:UDP-glucuronate decarboxylase
MRRYSDFDDPRFRVAPKEQFSIVVLPVTVLRAASAPTRDFIAKAAKRCAVKKRVLVTGGAGFLGSHLCARLLEQECQVLCVDNYFTGTHRNIEPLLSEAAFEVMRHDVTFPLHVEVDEIYNLACPASPIHYQHDPVQTTKTSVIGAINMLGLAKRLRARILQASTSEVYGDPDVHPQTEEYRGSVNFAGPRGCYDEGKRCAETLFYDYKRQHRLSIRVARIFNTYGPNMHPQDGRVVSSFIVQALKNEPITIYGSGSQTRSFCYVDDLVDGLTRLMNVEGDVDGPINLGNPVEITISELAGLIIFLAASRSRREFRPLPQDDPRQRCPDITRAKQLLHWRPAVPLKEGLSRTIRYFDNLLSSPNEAKRIVWKAAS